MIVTAAMASLLSTCAPSVGIATMAGVIQYESGWKPWSIGDNTDRRSYVLGSEAEAARVASALLNAGHNIDAGLAQVNSTNFATYGLTAQTAFDPCVNVRVGSVILTRAFRGAMQRNWIGRPVRTPSDFYYQQQYALIHALSAYNSGRYWASMAYAANVYDIARNVQIQLPASGDRR